jgi:hydroxypyruvate isomerase
MTSPTRLTRRDALKSGLAATAFGSLTALARGETAVPTRKNRIHQSACRWCYKDIPLDQLCAFAASVGMKGIDLLSIDEWEAPKRYGLICTMGQAGGGTIPDALNRPEHHDAIEAAFRTNIPLAAKAGVPNVITFSG